MIEGSESFWESDFLQFLAIVEYAVYVGCHPNEPLVLGAFKRCNAIGNGDGFQSYTVSECLVIDGKKPIGKLDLSQFRAIYECFSTDRGNASGNDDLFQFCTVTKHFVIDLLNAARQGDGNDFIVILKERFGKFLNTVRQDIFFQVFINDLTVCFFISFE